MVLEQRLRHTALPLSVLDPNADFTQLHQRRPGADTAEARSIHDADIRILHSSVPTGEQLKARFIDLSVPSKAAVLQLDPIKDAGKFNVLLHVLDLGGFAHPSEPKVAALAALEHLWINRNDRKSLLIVIDEAHNLCSPTPATPVERALTALIVQIAAEGRKYGLWLFLSTQRPTKIHPTVLSQCDNLGLMRMNSPRDLAELAEVFGFVPEELLLRSQHFKQGQGLFAGGFIAEPTMAQMRGRITQEGGSDVKVPVAPLPAG